MRKLKGVVVSDKMDKTAVVMVERHKSHPVYTKRFKVTNKFMVSDPDNALKIGDVIEIVEIAPVSKRTHFKVSKVLGRAEEVVKALEEQEQMETERAAREAERAAKSEAKVDESEAVPTESAEVPAKSAPETETGGVQ